MPHCKNRLAVNCLLILTAIAPLLFTTLSAEPPAATVLHPPSFDDVPVAVRDLKFKEKATFLVAVERKMQERFPDAEWSRRPDSQMSPGWAGYRFKTDDGQIDLSIFFGDSAKGAGQQLRELDYMINYRPLFQVISGIGDEAYQYGPKGMFLARSSNVLVKVSTTDPDQRQEVAKLVVAAVDEIVEQ